MGIKIFCVCGVLSIVLDRALNLENNTNGRHLSKGGFLRKGKEMVTVISHTHLTCRAILSQPTERHINVQQVG